MKIVDLNILLYAVNPSCVHHKKVIQWWEDAMNADEPIGLAWVVISGFIRLTTSPRIFQRPMTPKTALDKTETWLNHQNTRIVQELDEHWRIWSSLVEHTGAAGNLTTDAHLAALTISHGAVLASCDSDFARFEKLRWINPLKA